MLNSSTLAQFTGDMERYRHGLCRNLIYTPGVHYVLENGGEGDNSAHWLLDAIASYQYDKRINENEDAKYLQFWKIVVRKNKVAILTCDDGNGNILITQTIRYADFCLPEIQIWVGDNGDGTRTAYLPSEH
jgi:hypothetical protein